MQISFELLLRWSGKTGGWFAYHGNDGSYSLGYSGSPISQFEFNSLREVVAWIETE